MKFSAKEEEIRAICIPYPEKLTDYKNDYQRIEKIKEHELITEGVVRQVEITPYGLDRLS